MALASKLFSQAGEDLQTALESIDDLQSRVVIVDNDKLPYDQAIEKLDQDLFDQCLDVNKAFGVVETAYQDRIDNGCRSDLFWRITNINDLVSPTEYSLVCTKISGGGYTKKTDFKFPSSEDDDNFFGNTLIVLRPNGNNEVFPINSQNARGLGVGYTFGFEPRNYYGIKYYNEPYSDDIGDTLVGGFIGTITQGQSTLTIMNPVGAGLSELLAVGQIIEPQNLNVFSGTTKISGITTGLVDLRNIESLTAGDDPPIGVGDTLSRVNILTVDSVALRTIKAPLDDGTYGSFDVLDDPANFANSGRQKYSLNKELDPFLPQTVGIMQTANLGIGISVALDNSGFPSGSMPWNPALNGYSIEPSGTPIIRPPKVGSGVCFWRAGFDYKPVTSPGGSTGASEGDTATVEVSDIASMYSPSNYPSSRLTCSAALETAITDAIGIATAKETTLRGANDTTNPTKVEGLNALRGERNDDYSLPIWGMRCGIGAQNEIVDRLQTLQQHLDDLTIRNVIDS